MRHGQSIDSVLNSHANVVISKVFLQLMPSLVFTPLVDGIQVPFGYAGTGI